MNLDDETARLLDALAGLDLESADGRVGIQCMLAEIERRAPGAVLRSASRIDLQRVVRTEVSALARDGQPFP